MLSIFKHERKYGKGDQTFTHKHDFHELFFCKAGSAYELTPGRKRLFHEKETFFYPAGTAHNTCSNQKRPYTCFVLCFSESCMDDLKENSQTFSVLKTLQMQVEKAEDARLNLNYKQTKKLEALLEELLEKQYKLRDGDDWERRLLFEQILLSISKGMSQDDKFHGGKTDSQRIIQNVCDFIDAHFDTSIQVDDILEFCPLSRSHFFTLFKQITGRTFNNYLLAVRLEYACDLLKEARISITEIAYKSGFNSYSHFCYTFKKWKNCSPTEYQNSNK